MSLFTVTFSYVGEVRVKQVRAPSHLEVPPAWLCSLQIDDVLGLPEGFIEEASVKVSPAKVKPVKGMLNVWQHKLTLAEGEALLTFVQTEEKGGK